MRYELMRPHQIKQAVADGLALLMPVGVLEYHGEQNPVGVDSLISQGLAHAVEERVPCVVAPTIFYGYTGQWASDERDGEIHIDGDALYAFARLILRGHLRQGWRRIYVICHHQGPNGVTQLSYARAATEAAMEYALEQHGPGWHEDASLYPRILNRIRVVSDSEFVEAGFGGDGGRDETAAMMHFYPDTVDLNQLEDDRPQWARDADEANGELGRSIAERLIESWVAELTANRSD